MDVTKEAGLRSSRVFPAVNFAADSTGDLVALLCTHVDDLLFASTPEGNRIIQHVLDAFRIGKVEEGTFRLCGREYVQALDFSFTVNTTQKSSNPCKSLPTARALSLSPHRNARH